MSTRFALAAAALLLVLGVAVLVAWNLTLKAAASQRPSRPAAPAAQSAAP